MKRPSLADRSTPRGKQMPQFRKKPVVIEAMQWEGNTVALMRWIVDRNPTRAEVNFLGGDAVAIPTLEGTMVAERGDWIICGVKGELYPCKPDIFAATYEPVEENQPAPVA